MACNETRREKATRRAFETDSNPPVGGRWPAIRTSSGGKNRNGGGGQRRKGLDDGVECEIGAKEPYPAFPESDRLFDRRESVTISNGGR
ncbi:hypothetical protein SAMN04489841_3861 [Natrinema salaciae]|uniref:Uncharacterized protein n=1 Tax=Natrinema salaciae TaxID=1186196 RepID=A0A1H9P4Q5_9EURY|nr:hypothetical protein SAMN04489841_3861 [Natrinema salaciae]